MNKWETPEQYEKRTGEAWPDDWAVYTRIPIADIKAAIVSHARAKVIQHDLPGVIIVCATEAGPPPEGWRPEEDANGAE
jgi:hypothetical protein